MNDVDDSSVRRDFELSCAAYFATDFWARVDCEIRTGFITQPDGHQGED
jgi:hypothetical protein